MGHWYTRVTRYARRRATAGAASTALALALVVMVAAAAPAAAAPPAPEIIIAVTEAHPYGAPAVAQTAVTLSMNAPRAKQMRFSNDGGATWSEFEAYATTKAWELEAGVDGVRTVTAQFVDNKGVSHLAVDDTLLDTVAPWTGMVPDVDRAYYGAPIPLVFGGWGDADPSSGVAAFEYLLPGGEWQTVLAPAVPVTVWFDPAGLGEGEHEIRFRALDGAGNAETAEGSTEPRSVVRFTDTTPPTLTLPLPGWWSPAVPFAVAADDTLSGVATIEYRLGEGEWLPYGGPVTIDGDDGAEVTVEARAADAAGNVSQAEGVTLTLDGTAPLTTLAGAGGGWHTAPVLLTLAAADGGSGVESTEYSLEGGLSWTAGDSLELTTSGVYAVLYRSTDLAGNVEDARGTTVQIDLVGPRTSGRAASGRVGVAVKLRYRGTDDVSTKLYSVRVVVKDAKNRVVKRFYVGTRNVDTAYSVKWKPAKKGTYRYYVYAKDAAGLKQSKIGSARVVVR